MNIKKKKFKFGMIWFYIFIWFSLVLFDLYVYVLLIFELIDVILVIIGGWEECIDVKV